MNTDDLIARLAASPATGRAPGAMLVALFGAVLAIGVGLYLRSMGLRPDAAAALVNPVTLAKTLVPGGVAIAALIAAFHAARPGATVPLRRLWLAVPVLLALILWALWVTPVDGWAAGLRGHTSVKCVSSIALLGTLPLLVLLAGLRQGASTNPRLTGTLAGLASGAGAAAGYALSCGEDNPLFYVTWYGLAILGVTLAGALIGSRALRW